MTLLDCDLDFKGDKSAIVITDDCQSAGSVLFALNEMKVEMHLTVKTLIVCGKVFSDWEERVQEKVPTVMKFEHPTDVIENLRDIICEEDVGVVVDISGEPAIKWIDRMRLANISIGCGVYYLGADFCFIPPEYKRLVTNKPAISIYGIGKRVGKTSLTCDVVDLLVANEREVMVVTMSRKGPRFADIVNPDRKEVDIDYLMKRDMRGDHATADYLEISAITGSKTIGCSRVGSGLAGAPFSTLVKDGAIMSNDLGGDMVIFEGSGDTIPPVETDGSLFVISGEVDPDILNNPFTLHRLDRADIVILTGLQKKDLKKKKIKKLKKEIQTYRDDLKVFLTEFRSYVGEDVSEGKWLLFTTSGDEKNENIAGDLRDYNDCDIAGYSGNLSDEEALKEDIERLYEEHSPCGVIIELKGNAINVCGRFAISNNLRVVFLQNKLLSIEKKFDMSEELLEYLMEVEKKFNESPGN